jgi:class 3 adenylate cyclase/tetratricopeptide (TPR) repeat protein
MKCPKCQSQNPDDARFCNQCAARLEINCPDCGRANPPTSRFCNECARDLSARGEAPPVELSFEEKLDKIQRYLPDGLTEKILAQRGKIEGERKQVTVMFCDAEGFSLLSERLGPEKVYAIMDEVFETLIHKVHEYGGTVNKMTGDGVMALFGAPIALEDAPQRAIRSALAIQRDISRLSDRKKEETGNRPIRMRIGIHTGPVVVGTLGNDLRVEFTAVGDTVNLASRMEGLAEPGAVYVTDDTFKLTEGLFRFEALGDREVKGKEEPIGAYRVIAPSTRRTRFDVSAERGLTPFLGRERELELLLDGLERAKSGRGQAFSIMGEAGVGKSRLLYEFRKAISSEDVFFLEGRCLSYSTNVAYHPVIDLLKSTFDIHEDDNDERTKERVRRGLKDMGGDASSTLPFFLELLSVKDSGIDALRLTPEARKDKTLEALRRTVLKGSEARPLVIAIEDLHWVDKSSEEALKSLLDAISGAQVVLIFTYRPEFVQTWGTKSYHNQVNLNRLSNRETLAMAAHVLGTEVIGPDLEELILEKTEGIPFFVEEFMKSLKDLGMIEWRDSGYYLAKDIKDMAIPSTIQDVIMARVDALPEGAKNVLQTGSAIGREFSCELIKRVTGVPQPEITTHLSALRDSELLYERGIFPQATYIFRHSLTQEVAYDSLLEKRKQEIHERIAQAIEQLYSDRLDEFYEVLAHHYSMSEDDQKAYAYLKLAADRALARYSVWEAYGYGKAAINTLERLPDSEDRRRRALEIRVFVASLGVKLMWPEEWARVLDEGEDLAEKLHDERSLAILCSIKGIYYSTMGDASKGAEYSEAAFELAEKMEDLTLVAQAGYLLCGSYVWCREYRKAAEVAGRVMSALERMTAPAKVENITKGNLYAMMCGLYGWIMGLLGDFAEGQALCEKSIRIVGEADDPHTMGIVECHYGQLLVARGEAESAERHLTKAIGNLEQTNNLSMLIISRISLANAQYLLGDLDTPLHYLLQGLEEHGHVRSPMVATVYLMVGRIYLDLGDLGNARTYIERAVQLSQEYEDKHSGGLSKITLGLLLAKADASQKDEAVDSAQEGIKLLETVEARPVVAVGYQILGELCAETGQKDKALEALKRAEAEFKDMGMDYYLRKTQEALARVEG